MALNRHRVRTTTATELTRTRGWRGAKLTESTVLTEPANCSRARRKAIEATIGVAFRAPCHAGHQMSYKADYRSGLPSGPPNGLQDCPTVESCGSCCELEYLVLQRVLFSARLFTADVFDAPSGDIDGQLMTLSFHCLRCLLSRRISGEVRRNHACVMERVLLLQCLRFPRGSLQHDGEPCETSLPDALSKLTLPAALMESASLRIYFSLPFERCTTKPDARARCGYGSPQRLQGARRCDGRSRAANTCS